MTNLLDDRNVVFAGMKIPHPLEYCMQVRIRTNGSVTPQDAYNKACSKLQSQLANVKEQFKELVEEHARGDPSLRVDWEPDAAYEQQAQAAYGEQPFGAPYQGDLEGGALADTSLAFT